MTRRHLTDEPEFLTPDGPAWQSETAREFQVGDRVEVTGGIAECKIVGHPSSHQQRMEMDGHPVEFVGAAGIIEDYEYPEFITSQGHHIAVLFTPPIVLKGQPVHACPFAPSELRLIEPAG